MGIASTEGEEDIAAVEEDTAAVEEEEVENDDMVENLAQRQGKSCEERVQGLPTQVRRQRNLMNISKDRKE